MSTLARRNDPSGRRTTVRPGDHWRSVLAEDLFSAEKFIVTENGNYLEIETIGREIGKIN